MLLTENDTKVRPLIYMLAALPTFDCILNQINNAFEIQIGGLTLLQMVRGYLLFVLLLILLWHFMQDRLNFTGMHVLGLGGLGVIAVALTKELLLTGSVAMPSLGAYGQLGYWLVIGMTVAGLCRSRTDAKVFLLGLACGAIATSLSIVIGHFAGGLNPYEDDGVDASAGWFHTAKTITGVLLTGFIVLLYLGRQSKKWIATLLATLCAVACVMTYARAGLVAMGLVIAFFVCWKVFFGRGVAGQWLSKMLLIILLGSLCTPILIRSDSWVSRWQDIQDPDKAGSGRATFWRVAIDAYANAAPSEHILGFGYAGMAETLLHDYGEDIKHTHNDFLDSMLVGGFLGMGWLLSWFLYLIGKSLSLSISTCEGAVALAIVMVYLCHAQFTGQLFGTDSMSYYVTALAALFHLDSLRKKNEVENRSRLFSGLSPLPRHA